jgi:hypothetical protein
MTKEGALELQQMQAFCDLRLRARRASGESGLAEAILAEPGPVNADQAA